MKNIVTKKRLLLTSGILTSLFVIIDVIGTDRLCGVEHTDCMANPHSFFGIFIPILPLFLFSLITYKLPERVYRTWSRFALWWIPLSMLLILVVPSYDGSLVPVDKGRTALATSLFFLIISLTIVTVRLIKNPAKKQ